MPRIARYLYIGLTSQHGISGFKAFRERSGRVPSTRGFSIYEHSSTRIMALAILWNRLSIPVAGTKPCANCILGSELQSRATMVDTSSAFCPAADQCHQQNWKWLFLQSISGSGVDSLPPFPISIIELYKFLFFPHDLSWRFSRLDVPFNQRIKRALTLGCLRELHEWSDMLDFLRSTDEPHACITLVRFSNLNTRHVSWSLYGFCTSSSAIMKK